MSPEAAVRERTRGSEARKMPDAGGSVLALTTAISRGDPEAFAAFYEVWFDRCLVLARALTRRDESSCLDIVQDSMLRVIRSLRPMEDPGALARWMSAVVHSTALDHLRREARRARREERACRRRGISVVPGPSQDGDSADRMKWLADRIAELPREDRALIAARFEGGRTLDEAGRSAGLTGDAAHGRLRRAIIRLRRMAREVFHDGA